MMHKCELCKNPGGAPLEFEDLCLYLTHLCGHIDRGDKNDKDARACIECKMVYVTAQNVRFCSICRFEMLCNIAISPAYLIGCLQVDEALVEDFSVAERRP